MTEPTQPDRATSMPSPGPSRGRRRFLGAGATSTPALMLLASQPALGATCFTPSRSLSKNMSVSQQGKYGDCTGISPGNYKTQTNPNKKGASYNWPSAPTPDTAFHTVFAGSWFMVSKKEGGTRSLTLLEVLELNKNKPPADVVSVPDDPAQLAFHLVGAYLNVQKGLVPPVVLTSEQVRTLWSEFALRGYYEPTAGIKWYPGDIVSYLQKSGIAP